MNEQIKQIALRIREIREIAGLSAETMAEKLMVQADKYMQYQEGNADIPVGLPFNID